MPLPHSDYDRWRSGPPSPAVNPVLRMLHDAQNDPSGSLTKGLSRTVNRAVWGNKAVRWIVFLTLAWWLVAFVGLTSNPTAAGPLFIAIVAPVVYYRRWVKRRARAPRVAAEQASTVAVAASPRIGAVTGPGVLLGRSDAGAVVSASAEESVLIVGPPRSGKSRGLYLPALRHWDGSVVATSTKADLWEATRSLRRGRSVLFDPFVMNSDRTDCVRWSILAGCEVPRVAIGRADALAVDNKKGGQNDEFWRGNAVALNRALLHAAAVEHLPVTAMLRWLSRGAFDEPAAILDAGATDWGDVLRQLTEMAPETRESVLVTARRCFDALDVPEVRDAVAVDEIDVRSLLAEAGTVHLIGPARYQRLAAPVLAALVDWIVEVALSEAVRQGGRLDPPLLLALDEVANIAPLPSLPSLCSEGGGQGVVPLLALQSWAQARERWGRDGAEALFAASNAKLILGGATSSEDLEGLSRAVGDYDAVRYTHSTSMDAGTSSTMERRRILPPEAIRQLPVGRALLLHGHHEPMLVTLPGNAGL